MGVENLQPPPPPHTVLFCDNCHAINDDVPAETLLAHVRCGNCNAYALRRIVAAPEKYANPWLTAAAGGTLGAALGGPGAAVLGAIVGFLSGSAKPRR